MWGTKRNLDENHRFIQLDVTPLVAFEPTSLSADIIFGYNNMILIIASIALRFDTAQEITSIIRCYCRPRPRRNSLRGLCDAS